MKQTDLEDAIAQGTVYGYARTSTTDQANSLETQIQALKAAGCQMVRSEMVSGASMDGRKELRTLLEFLRSGDTLVVCKLDRLGRSLADVLEIITTLGNRGVGFKSLAESAIDTTTPAGRLMLAVFGAVAQFERERIKERQREGIEAAKAKGVYKGRKPTVPRARVLELKAGGMGPAAIARELGIGESSVFRVLREANN